MLNERQTGFQRKPICDITKIVKVSWIKHKTTQELLTVGLTTYANDARYQALHFYHGEDWSLQIKYVQGRDAGLYQCQVSTHPPQSIYVSLEVVACTLAKHWNDVQTFSSNFIDNINTDISVQYNFHFNEMEIYKKQVVETSARYVDPRKAPRLNWMNVKGRVGMNVPMKQKEFHVTIFQ
ncbi:cell wall protein DAN4-like isoform X5 [Vespula squamosa]|uniref:Cell wall protein DAN4-like isoform X5 n=1 Tax=Vespula squamosa TaxID=30214 RepID=A0ABD2AQA9_VESSQ